MDKQEILPCPFCGYSAELVQSYLYPMFFSVTCTRDNCMGLNFEQDEQGGYAAEFLSRELAIAAWNKRTPPKVKPLVWTPNPFNQADDCLVAKAPFNHVYKARRDPLGATYTVYLSTTNSIMGTLWWESNGHKDLDSAVAAGEADYVSRIREVLNY